MERTELNHEALFIQTVLMLADKYGVKAEIDYEGCHVNFVGDCDQEALALELSDIFGEYEE